MPQKFYDRTTSHKKALMSLVFYFYMDEDALMAKHLHKFDDLIVGLQNLVEINWWDMTSRIATMKSNQEYELITSILEISIDISLNQMKGKLHEEFERQGN